MRRRAVLSGLVAMVVLAGSCSPSEDGEATASSTSDEPAATGPGDGEPIRNDSAELVVDDPALAAEVSVEEYTPDAADRQTDGTAWVAGNVLAIDGPADTSAA